MNIEERLKQAEEALELCFVVMMQPGWFQDLEGKEKFTVYSVEPFVEARKRAEKMYYDYKNTKPII